MRRVLSILLIICCAAYMAGCSCGNRPQRNASNTPHRPSRESGKPQRNDTRRQNPDRTETIAEDGVTPTPPVTHTPQTTQPQPATGTLTPAQIYERCNPAVFVIHVRGDGYGAQGSGFYISPTVGVSNYHVFRDTYKGSESIERPDGRVCKVKRVIDYDANKDYIVFELTERSNVYIPLAKTKPKVGDRCYAIGSPRGYENTLSDGLISQLREGNHPIQISAPIDHGSSGGALLNDRGEAIGITTAGRDDSGANLNFAISVDLVRKWAK